jgi:predicted nuclease of predicted toxin-antitoxin system
MQILLDHNTPAPLRYALRGHTVDTAFERGWAELTNGDLLAAAESAGFEVLITSDQGIRYQQNLAGRKLSLLVLSTNDWTSIRKSKALVVAAVASIQSGE